MRFSTDRPPSWQACATCGNEASIADPATRCRYCGGLLEVHHRPPNLTRNELLERFTERRGAHRRLASGVWRFREVVLPGAEDPITHPEGNTPLLERQSLDRWAGVKHLLLKHEGYNPTGSFKDRGMTVGVTQAVRVEAPAVACASTGNTSASMGAYAAQAGLPALAMVPEGHVATGKLAQTLAYGVKTLMVRCDFDGCLRLAEAAAAELGIYLLNSVNPFRIEGQKTVVLELLQQLNWSPPDWIVVPGGNLGNAAAVGKALHEAHEWKLIPQVPRLLVVQAAGAAPFARSFADGFAQRHRVAAETVASAIRIGDPASYERAARAIRETDGIVIAVSDEQILEAKAAIDRTGIGCEPASAATLAGIRALTRDGTIGPEETVAAVLTGHILKDAGTLLQYHAEAEPPPANANRPIVIDPKLEEVEGVLDGRTTRQMFSIPSTEA